MPLLTPDLLDSSLGGSVRSGVEVTSASCLSCWLKIKTNEQSTWPVLFLNADKGERNIPLLLLPSLNDLEYPAG